MRLSLIAAVVLALALPASAAAIPPPIGGLTPVPGGCLTEDPTPGCTTDPGASDASDVAVSSSGKVLYVLQGQSATTNSLGAVMAYARNPRTGLLGARISCRANNPTNLPGCVGDPSLNTPIALAVPPDGHGIYVLGLYGTKGSLVSYATDPTTGAIGAPTGCFQQSSSSACGSIPAVA